MSDKKDSVERDDINKNDDVTLIDDDEESEEIDKTIGKQQEYLESENSEN